MSYFNFSELTGSPWVHKGKILAEKVIYINLDRRADRRQMVESEMKSAGITPVRFSAISYPGRGYLGCSLSHATILRAAADADVKNPIMVIEDDFHFTNDPKNFAEEVSEITRVGLEACGDWDIVLLGITKNGSRFYAESIGRDETGVVRIRGTQTTTGYLVSPSIIPRLAACFEESVRLFQQGVCQEIASVDILWIKVLASSVCLTRIPPLADQRICCSDIDSAADNMSPSEKGMSGFAITDVKLHKTKPEDSGILKMGLMGGLGNRLFQVAAALGISETYRRRWTCVDADWVDSHDNRPHNLLSKLLSEAGFFGVNEKEHHFPTIDIYEPHSHFCQHMDLPFDLVTSKSSHIQMHGYFQTEAYWNRESCKQFMRNLIEKLLENVHTTIAVTDRVWVMHIRRGDYVNNSVYENHWPHYYDNCLADIQKRYPENRHKIAIVSDDVKWCKTNVVTRFSDNFDVFIPENPSTVVSDVLHDLKVMTQAVAGIICCNSTFSWWGAWSGTASDRPAYIPRKWLTGMPDACDLLKNSGVGCVHIM